MTSERAGQMTSWQDLMKHRYIRDAVKALGECGPLSDPLRAEVKGTSYDDEGGSFSVYYSADDLFSMAKAIESIAAWLMVRKAYAENTRPADA